MRTWKGVGLRKWKEIEVCEKNTTHEKEKEHSRIWHKFNSHGIRKWACRCLLMRPQRTCASNSAHGKLYTCSKAGKNDRLKNPFCFVIFWRFYVKTQAEWNQPNANVCECWTCECRDKRKIFANNESTWKSFFWRVCVCVCKREENEIKERPLHTIQMNVNVYKRIGHIAYANIHGAHQFCNWITQKNGQIFILNAIII